MRQTIAVVLCPQSAAKQDGLCRQCDSNGYKDWAFHQYSCKAVDWTGRKSVEHEEAKKAEKCSMLSSSGVDLQRELMTGSRPITIETWVQMDGVSLKSPYAHGDFRSPQKQMHSCEQWVLTPDMERYETSFRHTQSFIRRIHKDDMGIKEMSLNSSPTMSFWLKRKGNVSINSVKYSPTSKKIFHICVNTDGLLMIRLSDSKWQTRMTAVPGTGRTRRNHEKDFPIQRIDRFGTFCILLLYRPIVCDVEKLTAEDISTGSTREVIWTNRQRPTRQRAFRFASGLHSRRSIRLPFVCRRKRLLPVSSNQKRWNNTLKRSLSVWHHKEDTFHTSRIHLPRQWRCRRCFQIETVGKMLGDRTETTQHYAGFWREEVSENGCWGKVQTITISDSKANRIVQHLKKPGGWTQW